MLGRLMRLLPFETLRGYQNSELVDVVFRKTVAYQPTEPWPDIAGAKTVLDFGGACGRHYKDAMDPEIRWAVVETPAMVARAKALETDRLKFFTDIDSASSWLGSIDVMHSNGALQFAPDPISVVRKLCSLNASRMLWYRLFLGTGKETQVSMLGDNGPGRLDVARKKVTYEFTRISEPEFLSAHGAYRLEARGDDWFRFTRNAA
jgi:putative methyltransferase (TIGR04325 family)